jgi:hypothetical protein
MSDQTLSHKRKELPLDATSASLNALVTADDDSDDGSDLGAGTFSDPANKDEVLFLVSNKGRVKPRITWQPSFGTFARGYFRYGSEPNRMSVHVAVCLKFVGAPPDALKTTVDHIDGNPLNNFAENLEWATQQEQVQQSWATNPDRKKAATGKPVEACKIGAAPENWVRYNTVQEAADACSTYQGAVSNVCVGRTKSSNGYKFRWADTGVPPLLDGEEWRQAIYDDALLNNWKVSNFGRVKSPTSIISNGSKIVDGYCVFSCSGSNYPIHAVVAHTFLGKPPADMENATPDHIDCNPSNNNVTNLRWATKLEQANNHGAYVYKTVIAVRKNGQARYMPVDSFSEASRVSGVAEDVLRRLFQTQKEASTGGFDFIFYNAALKVDGEVWRSFTAGDAQLLRSLPRPARNKDLQAQNRKRYRAERTQKHKDLQQRKKTTNDDDDG